MKIRHLPLHLLHLTTTEDPSALGRAACSYYFDSCFPLPEKYILQYRCLSSWNLKSIRELNCQSWTKKLAKGRFVIIFVGTIFFLNDRWTEVQYDISTATVVVVVVVELRLWMDICHLASSFRLFGLVQFLSGEKRTLECRFFERIRGHFRSKNIFPLSLGSKLTRKRFFAFAAMENSIFRDSQKYLSSQTQLIS